MPKLQHVNWDPAAASAAIAALNHAAQLLRNTADERKRAAAVAARDWQGQHRQTFDQYVSRAVGEAEDLAEMYKRRAIQLEQLDAQALHLNDQREREHEERAQREREGRLRGPR